MIVDDLLKLFFAQYIFKVEINKYSVRNRVFFDDFLAYPLYF